MIGWLVGVAALAVGAVVPLVRLRARKRAFEGAQTRARAAAARLGYCVETLHGGDDRAATHLLLDATERWHTAGALLATAGSPQECDVAASTAAEGLAAVRRACVLLGIAVPGTAGAP